MEFFVHSASDFYLIHVFLGTCTKVTGLLQVILTQLCILRLFLFILCCSDEDCDQKQIEEEAVYTYHSLEFTRQNSRQEPGG